MSLHEIHIEKADADKSRVVVKNDQQIIIDVLANQVWTGPMTLVRLAGHAGHDKYIRIGPDIYAFDLGEDDVWQAETLKRLRGGDVGAVLEHGTEVDSFGVIRDYAMTQQWVYLLAEGLRISRSNEGVSQYAVFFGRYSSAAPIEVETFKIEMIYRQPEIAPYAVNEPHTLSHEACAALMARPPRSIDVAELCMRKVESFAPPLMTATIEVVSRIDFVRDALVPHFVWAISFDGRELTPPRELREIVGLIEPEYRPFFEWLVAHAHEFHI